MFDAMIGMVSTYVQSLIHSEKAKAKERNIFLHLYKAIQTVYAGDPDFK